MNRPSLFKNPYIFFPLVLSFLFVLFFTMTLFFFNARTSAQQSGSNFVANRIIDDSLFYNGNEMTAAQIQQFLNARVPVCDTNGQQMHWSGQTRAQWAAANGRPLPPYTCLRDFVAASTPATNDSGICSPLVARTNRSAAQIIDDVARACNVSQKVLLVTLEKEQSLLSDTWPWPVQYEKAMGYYCPDDPNRPGWCAPEYAGFFNQVYNAARQLQRYRLFPTSFNHAINRTSFVSYQANAPSCGGTNLTIQTAGTAALYNYTPYQPNQAALNNMYGTGDSCSAYGNRNFWRMYRDWFGSTYGADYSWSLVSQSVFTDSTKSQATSTTNLEAGTRIYASVVIRNTGNTTWSNSGNNPVRFGTVRPQERISVFCDITWLSCSRSANMTQSTVGPNELATFEFWLNAPNQGVQATEYFAPVVEGTTWMNDIGLFYGISVTQPSYTWQLTSQYAYTDDSKTALQNLGSILPGQKMYVGFTAKNTGNTTWSNSGPNAVLVGTENSKERSSAFSQDSNWASPTRPAILKETSVAPGATGTFEFWITAPQQPGIRHERFNLVVSGITWMNDTGLSFYTNTLQPLYTWQIQSQYAYTDSTKTTQKNLASLAPNESAYIGFTAKNTGNLIWRNHGQNPVMLGTTMPDERTTLFAHETWPSGTRPAIMLEPTVGPGQTATFEFWITAPSSNTGILHERFNLIMSDKSWFNYTGLSFYTNVQSN